MALKRAALLVLALLAFMIFANPGYAAMDVEASAKGAIVMDAQSGQVLFEHNSHEKLYPASMTKLMTLILALEAIEAGKASLTDQVVVSENAAGYGGSQLYLEVGETFTLEEMLYAIMVGSANDASVALAEHLAGSEKAFVDLMNKKAKEIGAKNTHFTNSHGLHDPDHYTTPYDMALIARYSLRFPQTLEISATKYYEWRDGESARYNLNKLLWWYPGADGFKTGTTTEAGRNLVSTVQRDGLRLIVVVMGAEYGERYSHMKESMLLYNAAFRNYGFKEFYQPGQSLGTVAVGKGAVDQVDAVAKEKVGTITPKGDTQQYETRVELFNDVTAPVKKGQPLGHVVLLKDGQELQRVLLVSAQEVPRGTVWRQIGKTLTAVFTVAK